MKQYRYFDLIMAFFVAILIISNIASSAKIIDWGFSIFGVRLVFDAGTILFPVSYIFGDVLTEVYGYRNSRRVIWTGFACALLASITLWVVGKLPGEANWLMNVGQDSYDAILGGVGSGAIIVASLVAYFGGEFSNSFILAKLKIITNGRWLWSRTIGSTLVGEGLDTFLFVTLATLFRIQGFVPEIWLSLFLTNYIFKCGVEIMMTPITYFAVRKLKQVENEDFYDRGTNFNPFHG
jgi:queuosine precursor transporter